VLHGAELQQFGGACLSFMKKDLKREDLWVRLVASGKISEMDEATFVTWCINEADLDSDGRVDWSEFVQFVKTHNTWETFQIIENVDVKDMANSVCVGLVLVEDSSFIFDDLFFRRRISQRTSLLC
jgi:hypothetical protein